MKLTRTTALAALLFVALAAPAAAFALADDDPGTAHHAKHDKAERDKAAKGDKASKPDHATGEVRADEASAPGRAHAEAMKAWEPKPVDPLLRSAIARTAEGWGEAGDKVYAWSPVPSIGWTYVVVAPGSLL